MESLIYNKKAGFNYEILDKYTAGIELFGNEVKSVKGKHGSLDGAYISVRGKEAFLLAAFIPPYQAGNTGDSYDSYRARRLLLTKKEISELTGKESVKGLTIIPISVYNKNNLLKLEFGLAKPKKKFDKRETIQKRETDRDIRRSLKNE